MRDITLCHPRLQRIASAWIKACATEGITVAIGETLRTVAEQDALYAQGRTKPGNKVTNARGSSYSSQHQWGIAFDFYLKMDIDGDGSTSDDAFNDSTGMFKKAWAAENSRVPEQSKTVITDLKEIKSGIRGLRVTASSLIIRTTPKGTDTGKRYTKDQRVQPINKCFADGDPWIQTADGWISGKYLEGWLLQDGSWWYLLSGYTYHHDTVYLIDGQAYAFDSDGWMITADRIAEDGHIQNV